MTTAEQIKKALRRAKMRPGTLARELGISRSTVHDWVHGEHEPNLESLRGIARVLGCKAAELIGAS